MKLKRTLSGVVCAAMLCAFCPDTANESAQAATLPYLDTSLSFEERAADLVSRMTLDEKVAQMGRNAPAISRLGVSKYNYWSEAIHGVARQGAATSFPVSLAMSNTWDTELMYRAMDVTSTEARGKNNRYNLSYWNPTVNMARDPRWGRNEESYGEDPYLTAALGTAAVEGMQGDDEKYLKTISTIKHFAANNNENDRQVGTSIMSEKTLREYYTKAFGDITENASPASVMSSYNGITMSRNGENVTDYLASSANPYLLTNVLRRIYGFDGYVVGDCGAWSNLFGRDTIKQKLFPNLSLSEITQAMTTAKAVEAGNNLDCGNDAYLAAADAVEEGLLDEADIDRAVYELFLARMKTGEFDDDSTYRDITSSSIETDENAAVAEEAAEESWVLLENNNDTLPITSDVTRIAVVGSFADKLVLGDYSGTPTKNSTPIEGIRSEIAKINPDAQVQYLSSVSDTDSLFCVKSITLVKEDGTRTELDLSSAEEVSGMTLEDGIFKDVTSQASAVIPDVDFSNTKTIEAQMSTGAMVGGTLSIGYGQSGTVATIKSSATDSTDTYVTCSGDFDGQGGYDQTADMYISASAAEDFSVENYKSQLDAADIIIAYAATIPKQDGLGDADARESKDRDSIDLPSHESHVAELTAAYPDKTVVAMSTVGQINVEDFKDSCAALLWTSYNGQAQGDALGKILTGAVNPSGRLSTTWYKASDLEKMPVGATRQTIDGISYRFANYEIAQSDDFPGRTYQYYGGDAVYPFGYGKSYTSFEYSDISVSSDSADANDTITVTAKVKNTGSVSGTEVSQLYVSVPGADGVNVPLKQLKGFVRTELDAGESKTISFDLDISDVTFFDETTQAEYVPTGEYTIAIGKSSDETVLSAKVNVSGSIADEIERIRAIPSGIVLYGAQKDGSVLPANEIDANASITMKNHALIEAASSLDGASITYSSSDTSVANADSSGTITAGSSEGTALITVTAEYNGKTVTDSFPVVMQLKESISDEKRAEYISALDEAYGQYIQKAYSSENWAILEGIYTSARAEMESELLEENFDAILENAKDEMAAVEKEPLENNYTVVSSNPKLISGGIINYDTIGAYDAETTQISGTVTPANPLVIDLEALSNGESVSGDIVWSVEKLDSSSRKAPTIDGSQLSVYENGVFKITASNYDTKEYGELVVSAQLQIEGESADDSGGADLTDVKNGASNEGKNAGSTDDSWLRFDGVQLSKLIGVTFRVSQKNDDSSLKLSTIPGDDGVIAEATASSTGAWTNWEEVTAEVDRSILANASLDENNCGSIYVQTNGANLDYIIMTYINSDMDISNVAGGNIKVTVPYSSGEIIAARYNENNSLKDIQMQTVTASGNYTFGGYSEGDIVKFMAWDGLDTQIPLTASVKTTYKKPTVKTLTVFNLSDSAYDSFFDSADGTSLISGTGLDGIGGWNTKTASHTITYGDKEYAVTRALKGGSGSRTSKCIYFTPAADGVVTVYFEASTDRKIIIDQGSTKEEFYGDGDGILKAAEFEAVEGETLYIYGGGSNKFIYAVFFDTQKESTEPTASPEPTASAEPLPEITAEVNVEAESYTKTWPEPGSKRLTTTAVSTASGGYVLDNTRNNDIVYFGEQDITDLAAINVIAGTKEAANTAEFFAVDVSGLDVSSMTQDEVDALLTSADSLGSVTIESSSGWNDFKENLIRTTSDKTGEYGLFMKLTTTVKYCGNYDYFTLMYK